MKAVVMAGGEGSRLRPLTIRRPKPMVPIAGKPVMEHILNLLKRHGITEVIVTVQYLASNIEDYFGNGSQVGMHITYSREDVPLGTAGSVKNAEELLTEPFLVISGDALTDYNLTDIIRYHEEKHAMATLTLAHVPNPLEFGVIITNENGHITQFLEKPSWGEVFSDTINTGIYVLDPKIFTYFEKNKQFDFSQELFPMMLRQGDPIYGYIANGYWCDVGNLPEYMRANADALTGKVDIEIPAKNIGGNIWVEEGVEIDDEAQLYGPIYLAHDAKVKEGAIIHGPSTIGHYTIIDERAQVDRSIVWNNSYIGERAELRGALVGSSTSIKSKAVMFEGSVIGDNSIIQEGAIIQPNVKIWPDKEIEAGAVVNTSIIWGSQGRRGLFSRFGVTGLVNVDLTPEFATRLGAAYGAILPKGATACINRDSHRTSRMIKRGMVAGLPSAGINVDDINQVPIPVARYYIRTTDAIGGVHVRTSPFDQRIIDIKFFDQNGLDINKTTERKIENLFFREDYRRVYIDDIGAIDVLPNGEVLNRYLEGFYKTVNVDLIRKRKFQLVIDYAHSSAVQLLPGIFNRLGCEVIVLNTSESQQTSNTLTLDELDKEMNRLATITVTSNNNMGIRLDPSGERISVVDDRGRILDGTQLLAVMTSLFLRKERGGTVAVPVTAPNALQHIAQRNDGHILHT
ncbi:MAG TPA: sugar phosphate nucleotidyltransferase, partial [Ktedonobacteraceae bacterium]|nr:sugar phosphate nucleotidyltransferase [Ktedonobacteraceae bacterium]